MKRAGLRGCPAVGSWFSLCQGVLYFLKCGLFLENQFLHGNQEILKLAFVVAELVFTRLLRFGVNRARPFAAAPHSRPALLFCLALRLFASWWHRWPRVFSGVAVHAVPSWCFCTSRDLGRCCYLVNVWQERVWCPGAPGRLNPAPGSRIEGAAYQDQPGGFC